MFRRATAAREYLASRSYLREAGPIFLVVSIICGDRLRDSLNREQAC